METIAITNEMTPNDFLLHVGYKNEGTEIDRRGKKHVLYSKDGRTFEFKGCDLTGESRVIKLVLY